MADPLAICSIQSTLDIVHIYDTHKEANHSYSKVKGSTVSGDERDQPHGSITINGIVSVYDEPNVLMVLEDAQAIFWKNWHLVLVEKANQDL